MHSHINIIHTLARTSYGIIPIYQAYFITIKYNKLYGEELEIEKDLPYSDSGDECTLGICLEYYAKAESGWKGGTALDYR